MYPLVSQRPSVWVGHFQAERYAFGYVMFREQIGHANGSRRRTSRRLAELAIARHTAGSNGFISSKLK